MPLQPQQLSNPNSSWAISGLVDIGGPSGAPEDRYEYTHKVHWTYGTASCTDTWCAASGSLADCDLGCYSNSDPIIEFTHIHGFANIRKGSGVSTDPDVQVTGVTGFGSDSSSGGLGTSSIFFFPSSTWTDPSAGGIGWTDAALVRRTWNSNDVTGHDFFNWDEMYTSGFRLCMRDPTNGQSHLKDDPTFTRMVHSYILDGMINPYNLRFKQADGCPWNTLGDFYDYKYGAGNWFQQAIQSAGIHLEASIIFRRDLNILVI